MSINQDPSGSNGASSKWDHGSDSRFTSYYADASVSERTFERFEPLKQKILAFLSGYDHQTKLQVADVGCGPGTQAMMWAADGHLVHGIDVNRDFITLAKSRARAAGLHIEYLVGSATDLPWEDASMDVCLLPELLEHVPEWEACLDEVTRVLRPGGLLYLSTSNRLCPLQQEFKLPLYSWYPKRLKRHYERLSVTTRPELVNYANYPAVNWFSYYSLQRELNQRGMQCFDRFQFNALVADPGVRKWILSAIAVAAPLRLFGQIATPYTFIVAMKPKQQRPACSH